MTQEIVALVTGGSSGIGRATALAMAAAGAHVVIGDRDRAGGAQTADLVARAGGQALFVEADMTDPVAVKALIDGAVSRFGRLDWAVNAAGYPGKPALTPDWDPAEIDRAYDVNVKGLWHCLREELRQMQRQGGGSIVNIASAGGLIATPWMSGYGASKHAVVGLTRSAAVEFAPHNVRVNAICPGGVRTPMMAEVMKRPGHAERVASVTPMGRMAEPKEIAACALFLCSAAASYVTGVALPVDGGVTAQ